MPPHESINVPVQYFSVARVQVLAFLMLIAVLCTKVLWEIDHLAELRSSLAKISQYAIPEIHLTEKLATLVSEKEDIVLSVFLNGDWQDAQAKLAELKDRVETSRVALLALQSALPHDRQVQLITELQLQYNQLDLVTDKVLRLIQQDDELSARKLFMGPWEALHHAIFFNLDLLSAHDIQQVQDLVEETDERIQSAGAVSVILAMTGLILSVLLAMMVLFWLQRPVQTILQSINRIMRGGQILATEIEETTKKDLLSQRFNELISWLHGTFEDSCHELRTYITIILGEAEVALRKPAYDPEFYRESLVSITNAAEQMGQLVDDLVFLGRAQVGQMQYHITPVDVDELTQNVIRQCRRLASMKQIDLHTESPVSATINGDFLRLCQVLIILLENAVKYTAAGGKVGFTCTVTATHVEWCITDTGIGIAAEDLPHIFRRFYRATGQQPRSTSGTGLGLAIAQSIVQAHNGEIQIDSTLEVGTEVTVSIPRCN